MPESKQVLSVNVSLPRSVEHDGAVVRTGIFKLPRSGRTRLLAAQLEGDGQADLRFHGGPNKAVYAYPFEHYAFWSQAIGRRLTEYGQFGENLTVTGLVETDVSIGDVLAMGSIRLQVTQPRKPCFKLGLRLGQPTFPKEFLASGRLGFYCRVVEQGDVAAGDAIQVVERGQYGLTVADVWRILFVDKQDAEGARRALRIPWLADEFRRPLQRRVGPRLDQ